MSPNHLSQVINQLEGKNFFDFVNAYRVEEVKRKMADDRSKKLTLLAIALESGFNSKTSFNMVFKKMTGQTPSQYYKSPDSRQVQRFF
jgi:AraC-like DNA-binding protein